MGGRLTVLIRTSKSERHAFKIGTWQLRAEFSTRPLLSEAEFLKRYSDQGLLAGAKSPAEHEDYDSDRALFAPYHYGLLLIDFKEKVIANCNNFNVLGFFSTRYMSYMVPDWLGKDDCLSLSDEMLTEIPDPYWPMISQCLSAQHAKGIDLRVAGNLIKEPTFEALAAALAQNVGIERGSEDLQKFLSRYDAHLRAQPRDSEFGLYDIQILPKGWSSLEFDTAETEKMLSYCQERDLITESDLPAWTTFIEEQTAR